MERWHTSWLGLRQFPTELSAFDLDQFFTLDATDQQIVASRRRSLHRLGIALQIGFIRMTGCTLDVVQIVPLAVHMIAASIHRVWRCLPNRFRNPFPSQANQYAC